MSYKVSTIVLRSGKGCQQCYDEGAAEGDVDRVRSVQDLG